MVARRGSTPQRSFRSVRVHPCDPRTVAVPAFAHGGGDLRRFRVRLRRHTRGCPVRSAPDDRIPHLWGITLAILLGLLAVDFAITRRPHDVHMKEAVGWTIFYLALPVAFG